jgi:acyl-CoA synthetase (AMP-forming)/AMP-acid ligase II
MEKHFNIVQRLRDQAKNRPDVLALIQPGRTDEALTYAELDKQSQNYANFFLQSGITPEDRALLLIAPGLKFYAVFLGLARAGITVMLVDPGVGTAHVRACLSTLRPTVFIGTPKAQLLRFYAELRHPMKAFCTSALPFTKRLPTLETFIAGTDRCDPFPAPAGHPALITFTSGSTGRPKAILRTHGFLLEQGDTLATLMPARPDDVEFCSFPVFVLANLGQGISTILPPVGTQHLDQTDWAGVLQSMHRYHATRLLAAPNFCFQLAQHAHAGAGFQRLRHIHTGGGPVFPGLLQQLAALAPQAELTALYGSTEAEPIALQHFAALDASDIEQTAQGAGLCAGRPVASITLRILRDQTGQSISPMTLPQFNDNSLSVGDAGEIVVTGPLVQKSYINRQDNAETKFEVAGETWHRTGDAGYLDSRGRLWLLGRCNAKIRCDDAFVYPFALEAAATLQSRIHRAALIEVNGKNILALEGSRLDAFAEAQLKKRFPLIDKLIYLSHIPVDKRHHSKVLYAELKNKLLPLVNQASQE